MARIKKTQSCFPARRSPNRWPPATAGATNAFPTSPKRSARRTLPYGYLQVTRENQNEKLILPTPSLVPYNYSARKKNRASSSFWPMISDGRTWAFRIQRRSFAAYRSTGREWHPFHRQTRVRLGLQPLTGRPVDRAISATLWTRSQFTSLFRRHGPKTSHACRPSQKLGYRTGLIGKWRETVMNFIRLKSSITFTVCGPVQKYFYNAKKDDK